MVPRKTLQLPTSSEGLGWIASQGPSQPLLIPGLQMASITAAGAGDAQALAYIRFTAQQFAALGSRNHTPLDELCFLFIASRHVQMSLLIADLLIAAHCS
ncbi:hypothetical protein WJX74_007913 [Apatococcus lobatus]|uniref:Uncharacterized protein n=2 Tax=Apatococcus TaxID=904362 RepID=A0AAW1SCQ7_9CHLO